MRTFNLRLVLWLAGIFLVLAVVVHFVHGWQVRRHAVVYLELAQQQDQLARESVLGSPEWSEASKSALRHYRRYLSLQPRDVESRAELARFLLFVGDLKGTYTQCERVLREDPDNEEIRNMQVDVTMAGELYPDAEAHLKHLLDKTDPQDRARQSELLEKLGLCQMLSIRFDDAKATYEQAIELAPERPTTYMRLATLLRGQMNRRDEANAVIDKMLALSPDDPFVLHLHATYLMQDTNLLSRSDNLTTANADLDKAVAILRQRRDEEKQTLTPDDAYVFYVAYGCKLQQRELFVARDLLKESIAIDPTVPDRYLQLANLEVMADPENGLDTAIQLIRDSITAIPGRMVNFKLRWKLADLLMDKRQGFTGEIQRKEREIAALQRANSDATAAATERDQLRAALDTVQQELAVVRSELKSEGPNSPQTAFLDAREQYEEQRWSDAKQILEQIRPQIARSDRQLQARVDRMLGNCYTQLSDPDLALSTYQRMLADNASNPEIQRAYALTLAAMNRLPEALREFEQLIKMLDYGDEATRSRDAAARIDARKEYYQLVLMDVRRQPASDPAARNWNRVAEALAAVEDEIRSAYSVPATEPVKDPFVWITRANLLNMQGKVAESRELLDQACAVMPNEQSVWRARALVAQQVVPAEPVGDTPAVPEGQPEVAAEAQQQAYAESARLYAEIEAKFGDSVALRLNRAQLLIKEKGAEGVAELAGFVENSDKFSAAERTELNIQLAVLCLTVNSKDEAIKNEAIKYGQEAARLAPNSLSIRRTLLQIARAFRDTELAEEAVNEISRIEKGSTARQESAQDGPVTLYSRAIYDLMRYQKAIESRQKVDAREMLNSARQKLLQAQVLREKWAQIPLLLGDIAVELRDEETAFIQYGRAIDLGSRDSRSIDYVAKSLLRRNRIDEATQMLALLNEDPSEVSADIALTASRVSYRRKDFEDALEWAEVPLKRGTQEFGYYLWLSQVYQAIPDWDKAKQAIRDGMALTSASDDPQSGTDKDVAYPILIRLLMEEAATRDMAADDAEGEAVKARTESEVAASQDKADEAEALMKQAQEKEQEAEAQKQNADRLREEARQVLAEAEANVLPERKVRTVALCLAELGDVAGAYAKFKEARDAAPDDLALRDAAVRFYLQYSDRYPELRTEAKSILEELARAEDQSEEDSQKNEESRKWVRQQLARIQGETGNYQEFLRAMVALNANLEGQFPTQGKPIEALTPEDLRLTLDDLRKNVNQRAELELRAKLLARYGLLSLQREAIKILEWLATSPDPMDLDTRFLLGQLYLAVGDWSKGSAQMEALVRDAQKEAQKDAQKTEQRKLSVYLIVYIDALLDHYEVAAAKRWVRVLKQELPHVFDVYVREARTLVPKKNPGTNAVPPPWQFDEALEILQTAEKDKAIRQLSTRDATEEQDADAKQGTIVKLLEELLQETVTSRPDDDPQPIRDLIEQYYRNIVRDIPARQLMQVPYLVREGRRGEAVNLIVKYWESTSLEMLATMCGATLSISDEEKENLPAEQQAELDKQLAEVEGVLQQVLLKTRTAWEGAADGNAKGRALQEYLLVMSVVANHYVNTKRFPEAVSLYTEILKHHPGNTVALNNRAMLLAAQPSNLETALGDISKVIMHEGPLPMLVDTQSMVLRAAGNHPQALVASKRVISERPSQLDAASNKNLAKQWGGYYFHLALMCDANGDTRGAADAMREAVALGFGSSDVFDPELPDWTRLVTQFNMEVKPGK